VLVLYFIFVQQFVFVSFNESVDHLTRELCSECEVLNEIFIEMGGEYDRLTLVWVHELCSRLLDF
jgi:hypothetical protein